MSSRTNPNGLQDIQLVFTRPFRAIQHDEPTTKQGSR